MASTLFQITGAEMQAKVAPSGSDYEWKVDASGDITEAELISDILNPAEAIVAGYLRLKYQRLLRKVDGEFVANPAAGGETTLQAGLFPLVANSVKVFKSFPECRAWRERRPYDSLTEGTDFSVSTSTGVITLNEALVEGDVVALTYDHTAASKLLSLKKAAMDLAAAEVAARFGFFKSADGLDRFTEWKLGAREFLRDLARGEGQSIEIFEALELVSETRSNALSDILG